MIILGAITVVFGIGCFFLLVDNPKNLRLTPEQEQVMKLRTIDNSTIVTKEIKYYQMIEALKEPRFYCFIFASLLFNLQNGALSIYSAIITAGFGFDVGYRKDKQCHKLNPYFFFNRDLMPFYLPYLLVSLIVSLLSLLFGITVVMAKQFIWPVFCSSLVSLVSCC
jgi:hypothetical protein